MVRQITPEEAGREIGWEQYHNSPMPYATFAASIDAGNLMAFYSRNRDRYRLNTLILHLILKACMPVKETKLNLIDGKIYEYDRFCISYTMHDDKGKLRNCSIPYNEDLDEFQAEYNRLSLECRTRCQSIYFNDLMKIGTSSLGAYNVNTDVSVPAYCPLFNNPFFMIGKIMEQEHKKILKISLSFHHVLMDGEHACAVFENLQNLIYKLN